MAEPDVTQLLHDVNEGRSGAFDRLAAQVYPALRQLAHGRLHGERVGHTLNTTGLVHEAYLKLVRYPDVRWKGRAYFFGAAAQAMRRILVDHARERKAHKRSGERVTLTHFDVPEEVSMDRLIELDDALTRMSQERPRWARIIECRYFGGLSIQETAEVLGISHGTVSNDWRLARAWLRREMET